MKTFCDKNGKPYVKASQVAPGVTLVTDGGFLCMDADEEHIVFEQINNGIKRLCIYCKDDLSVPMKLYPHDIEGEYEEREGYDPYYLGFYLKGQ